MVEILDLPYTIKDRTDAPLKLRSRLGSRMSPSSMKTKRTTFLTTFLYKFPLVNGRVSGDFWFSKPPHQTITASTTFRLVPFSLTAKIFATLPRHHCQNIAYVPQNLHSSIVRFSKTLPMVIQMPPKGSHPSCKLAHADEFIKHLPKGYDTLVGERGVKLSVANANAFLSLALFSKTPLF